MGPEWVEDCDWQWCFESSWHTDLTSGRGAPSEHHDEVWWGLMRSWVLGQLWVHTEQSLLNFWSLQLFNAFSASCSPFVHHPVAVQQMQEVSVDIFDLTSVCRPRKQRGTNPLAHSVQSCNPPPFCSEHAAKMVPNSASTLGNFEARVREPPSINASDVHLRMVIETSFVMSSSLSSTSPFFIYVVNTLNLAYHSFFQTSDKHLWVIPTSKGAFRTLNLRFRKVQWREPSHFARGFNASTISTVHLDQGGIRHKGRSGLPHPRFGVLQKTGMIALWNVTGILAAAV